MNASVRNNPDWANERPDDAFRGRCTGLMTSVDVTKTTTAKRDEDDRDGAGHKDISGGR